MNTDLRIGIILHIGITNMGNSYTKDRIIQDLINKKMNFKIITSEFDEVEYANTVSYISSNTKSKFKRYNLRT